MALRRFPFKSGSEVHGLFFKYNLHRHLSAQVDKHRIGSPLNLRRTVDELRLHAQPWRASAAPRTQRSAEDWTWYPDPEALSSSVTAHVNWTNKVVLLARKGGPAAVS